MRRHFNKNKATASLLALLAWVFWTPVYAADFGVGDNAKAQVAASTKQGDTATLNALMQKKQTAAAPAASPAGQKKGAASAKNATQQASAQSPETSIADEAFANTARTMIPMTQDQIRALHRLFDGSVKAASEDPGVPPKATSTSRIIDMSPGATPPVIRLSQGFITSLVFIDATGAPWPIQAYDLGNPKAFNIQWDSKGNTLMIQALLRYKAGNIAVVLKGMQTPVMISLMPGQTAVDYRVDLRVPRLGPNANPVLQGLPASGSQSLMRVLEGVPPQGAQALRVTGGECQVWSLAGRLYVRTAMTILSPAWISTMSSPDGTHAYVLQKTPVMLAMRHGKVVKLTIEGL